MILKYVLKNFTRRKVRTILMILSLVVSTGLVVTMSATVETFKQSTIDVVASGVGRADFSVARKDTSSELFLPIGETAARILAAHQRIEAVHPRLEIEVAAEVDGKRSDVTLVGLDPVNDDVGTVDAVEGEYALGGGRVAVTQRTANELGLELGDAVDLSYALPLPRQPGKAGNSGASSVRFRRQFMVGGIVQQDGVLGGEGILAELAEVQNWLGLRGRAKQMVVVVDPGIYEAGSSRAAALAVRDVARAVQEELGDAYRFNMDLARSLSGAAQLFRILQALINTYGLISLGVVGLLVHTLVMTNVHEQRRDMAVLRILGSQRGLLFALVIVEVVVIGLIGVALGIVLGQALTTYVLAPVLERVLAREGLALNLVPRVSAATVLPPVASAFAVLIGSSLKPAREASRTKVVHAINPSAADNIQLEDLAELRERRPDGKMFLAGTLMTAVFVLVTGFEALGNFGGETLQVVFGMLGLMGMVLGVSLMFFITTIPFERLVLAAARLISPRLTYFARRNVSRGKTRNTLIALLVLFSAVLPSFLGTQTQLELANSENRSKMWMGAPIRIEAAAQYRDTVELQRLTPSFVRDDLAGIAGIGDLVGLSYPYATRAEDVVGLRRAEVNVVGLDGDLSRITFPDMAEFTAGGLESLGDIVNHQEGVIVSEGLARHLAVGQGEWIELHGEGLDHVDRVRVVGIARRIPGFEGIERSSTAARSGSTVLVSMEHFGRLVTPLDGSVPGADDALLDTVLGTLQAEADPQEVGEEIQKLSSRPTTFWVNLLAWQLEANRSDMMVFVILLLTLTGISFTTAVLAVFAVIYVTVYARRIEIGMLKSMGMLRGELRGMLIVEAIVMTLGSALAGIAAGASMGYLNFYVSAALEQMPALFAVDRIVMPAIIVLVVLASMLAAAFSSRRIVRQQAVEILRMS